MLPFPDFPISPRTRPDVAADGFRFHTETPVSWGDMDAFAHLNNVLYLRYFETARVEYFRAMNFMTAGTPEEIGPIVASLTCNYRRPVTYPDRMVVAVRCLPPKTTSFTMEFQMLSLAQHGALVADGSAVIVNFHYGKNEKAPISDEFRAALATFEGR